MLLSICIEISIEVELNTECLCPDCTNCSCCHFLDTAVCSHLVACCIAESINFPGIKLRSFVSKTKSKKRKAGYWYEKE